MPDCLCCVFDFENDALLCSVVQCSQVVAYRYATSLWCDYLCGDYLFIVIRSHHRPISRDADTCMNDGMFDSYEYIRVHRDMLLYVIYSLDV